jgi:hypothetical protein
VARLGEAFSMRDLNISKGEQREIRMSSENLYHGFQWPRTRLRSAPSSDDQNPMLLVAAVLDLIVFDCCC